MEKILTPAQYRENQPDILENNYSDEFLLSSINSAERKLKAYTNGLFLDVVNYNYISTQDGTIINPNRNTNDNKFRTDLELDFMFDAFLETTKLIIGLGNDTLDNQNQSFSGYGVSYSDNRNTKFIMSDDIRDLLLKCRLIKNIYNNNVQLDTATNTPSWDNHNYPISYSTANDLFLRKSTSNPAEFNKYLTTDSNGKIIFSLPITDIPVNWGNILGDINNQTDLITKFSDYALITALDTKLNLTDTLTPVSDTNKILTQADDITDTQVRAINIQDVNATTNTLQYYIDNPASTIAATTYVNSQDSSILSSAESYCNTQLATKLNLTDTLTPVSDTNKILTQADENIGIIELDVGKEPGVYAIAWYDAKTKIGQATFTLSDFLTVSNQYINVLEIDITGFTYSAITALGFSCIAINLYDDTIVQGSFLFSQPTPDSKLILTLTCGAGDKQINCPPLTIPFKLIPTTTTNN